jgi:ABC-type antimicrobial peptide transport system permease subunit
MFSLIITIISIALVAALALATLYFGGDAFNQGSAKAAAATIVNQASQINGANTLYFLDEQSYANGNETALKTALVDNSYLSSMPSAGDSAGGTYAVESADDASITLTDVKSAVCEAVNIQSGLMSAGDSIPVAGSDDLAGLKGAITTQFGCAETIADSGSYTFLFK